MCFLVSSLRVFPVATVYMVHSSLRSFYATCFHPQSCLSVVAVGSDLASAFSAAHSARKLSRTEPPSAHRNFGPPSSGNRRPSQPRSRVRHLSRPCRVRFNLGVGPLPSAGNWCPPQPVVRLLYHNRPGRDSCTFGAARLRAAGMAGNPADSNRRQRQSFLIKAAQLYEQAASLGDSVSEAVTPSGQKPASSSAPEGLLPAAPASKLEPKLEPTGSVEESGSEPPDATAAGQAAAVRVPALCSLPMGNAVAASFPVAAATPGAETEGPAVAPAQVASSRPRVLFRVTKHQDGGTSLEPIRQDDGRTRDHLSTRGHGRNQEPRDREEPRDRDYYDHEHNIRSSRKTEPSPSPVRGRTAVRTRRHRRSRSRSCRRTSPPRRRAEASPSSSSASQSCHGQFRTEAAGSGRRTPPAAEHLSQRSDSPPEASHGAGAYYRGCRAGRWRNPPSHRPRGESGPVLVSSVGPGTGPPPTGRGNGGELAPLLPWVQQGAVAVAVAGSPALQTRGTVEPKARRLASPQGDFHKAPSTHWERRKFQPAQPKGIGDSDAEDCGAWISDNQLPKSPGGPSLGQGGASSGTSPPERGGGKGKWKGGRSKKDKWARRDKDYADSRAMAGILRHGCGRRGAAALATMGAHGEVAIAVLAGLLHLQEDRIREVVASSIHPSGYHRYELVSFSGQEFVRATGKHSLEMVG